MSAGAIQLPLRAIGVASLVASSPLAFDLLRYAGGLFLVWLAIRLILRRSTGQEVRAAAGDISRGRAFIEGLVSNLANPIVMVLAFLPQFVDAERGAVAEQLLMLGGLQKLTGLFILGVTALAAGKFGDWLSRRPAGWSGRSGSPSCSGPGYGCC